MSLHVVVEGRTDESVVRRLAEDAGLPVSAVLPMRGKQRLDRSLPGFNGAANGSPWFVLRDLDHDEACAPAYLGRLRLRLAPWMVFRLAVREVESWLLADRAGIATYLGVPVGKVPGDPDDLDDPKAALVDLARLSPKVLLRRALVPRAGDSTPVGPLYQSEIMQFSGRQWDLRAASRRSPSLRGARRALRALSSRWLRHTRGAGV